MSTGTPDVRRGTVSAFNGPEPTVEILDSVEEEVAGIAAWLRERTREGVPPEEVGIFVRSSAEIERAKAAVHAAELEAVELDGGSEAASNRVAVGSMHLAKGLEFRAVVVAACDDEVIPLQFRIEAIVDEADLEDVYNTERQLLYVALHARAGSPVGHGRGTGVGVPGRHADAAGLGNTLGCVREADGGIVTGTEPSVAK